MINIDMDAIKSRLARVVRDQSGRPRRFDGQLVDDAARLVAEVERLCAAKTARWEQDGEDCTTDEGGIQG